MDIETAHIRLIHEGVRFDCNHCDYKATRVKSIQEGVWFNCTQCGRQSTPKSHLKIFTIELFGRLIKPLIQGKYTKEESLTATTVTIGLLGSIVLLHIQSHYMKE